LFLGGLNRLSELASELLPLMPQRLLRGQPIITKHVYYVSCSRSFVRLPPEFPAGFNTLTLALIL
jgi:hypothetical protein